MKPIFHVETKFIPTSIYTNNCCSQPNFYLTAQLFSSIKLLSKHMKCISDFREVL